VDPALTYSLSPEVTASTGLDALTQLIEAFVSRRANPFTDALALEGIRRAGRSLLRAYSHGDDAAAREDLALASLLSGIALANAGLGAVHGFASPLGGRYPVPHGTACAALLPHVLAANVRALRAREPDGPTLAKYAAVGEALMGGQPLESDAERVDAAVRVAAELCRRMAIPQLREFGARRQDVPDVVAQAEGASSMKGNPIALTREELAEVLLLAVG
jgi:alcohol dehydrogenase class IV